ADVTAIEIESVDAFFGHLKTLRCRDGRGDHGPTSTALAAGGEHREQHGVGCAERGEKHDHEHGNGRSLCRDLDRFGDGGEVSRGTGNGDFGGEWRVVFGPGGAVPPAAAGRILAVGVPAGGNAVPDGGAHLGTERSL